jgi:acetyl esterase/lipase
MDPTARGILTAFVLKSWSQVYDVPLATVADRGTRGIIDRATGGCVGGKTGLDQLIRVFALRGRLGGIDLPAHPRWRPLLEANSVPRVRGGPPLLVVSASADKVVADGVTRSFVTQARADGADVTFIPISGGDHATTAIETAPKTVDWLTRQFDRRSGP